MARMLLAAGLVASAGVVAANHGGAQQHSVQGVSSTPYRVNRILGDPRIIESSGLARSTYSRDVLFTHNDSGDSPRFFAVGSSGATRAVFTLNGATARDWEDMAAGPGHTLWLGDIGDNAHARKDITVYKVGEPATLSSRSVAWTAYRFAYPDGRHDAEALLVHPRTGRVFIVTKSPKGAAIYRAPKGLSRGSLNRLTRVGTAPVGITGGAFIPGGKRFVLRGYGRAYIYEKLGDMTHSIQLPSQKQGESVEADPSGKAILIGTEGRNSPVLRVQMFAPS